MTVTIGAITLAVAKAALSPVISSLKPQLARRKALDVSGTVTAPASEQIYEAIDLLSVSSTNLTRTLVEKAKKVVSDVPNIFEAEEVRLWLQRDDVRELVARGARSALSGRAYNDLRTQAGQSFAEMHDDEAWWGEAVFDLSVAFVSLTLKGRLSKQGEILLDSMSHQNAVIEDQLEQLKDSVQQPADAVRALIEPFMKRAEQLRSLMEPERLAKLIEFSKRANDGNLQSAEANLKIELFRNTAAALARADRTDEAESWVERARDAGATDLACDTARIALVRGDTDSVFDLLRDRSDGISIMLCAEALKRTDGAEQAVEFVQERLKPADMTGWALAALSHWLAEIGSWDEAERLLADATVGQREENVVLPYSRMRLRLAMMVNPPEARSELVETDKGLPLPGRLRTDAEGHRLRELALKDLAEFRAKAPEMEAGQGHWFDAQRLFLEIFQPNTRKKKSAIAELKAYCNQPETSVLFSWLASSLGIAFDDQTAKDELSRKATLGGLRGHELHAALQLTMNNGTAEDVLAFLERYEDKLETAEMPKAVILAMRIEATAKTGRIEEARKQLDQWQDQLDENVAGSLVAIIAEEETGSASVELRRDAYMASKNVADLVHLIEAMIDTNHEDLGEFAILLWTETHRVAETVNAANALFNAGRDSELDALLEQIGDAGEHDANILRHRAWAALRNGDLDNAMARVLALREDLPDDGHLRQLQINIALEAGRWKELAPLAHEDLARSEFRSARQLLQGAGLAQIVDDPVAEELARAAVAKAPTNPDVLISAFNAAIHLGTDWGSEAGSWLRSAIQYSDAEGPVQSAGISEFIEIAKGRQEQNAKLNEMIMTGQLPLEIAARPLGVTLSELFLDLSVRDAGERDARTRLCLPIVAGNRARSELDDFSVFAFDFPSLLVLEAVGLLDDVLSELPNVRLGAGTMPQLFHDFIQARRGQKSRVVQAEAIKALILADKIEIASEPKETDDELGEIQLAKSVGAQFVHSYPIYEPGSNLEHVADLGADEVLVVSPASVIDALQDSGEIDHQRAQVARSVLGDSSNRWPNENNVDLSQPLLLHVVALNALHSAGVLDTLIAASASLMICKDTAEAVDREITDWQQSQNPLQAIEQLRDKLLASVSSGKTSYGAFRRQGDNEEDEIGAERGPLATLLSDATQYDVLVSGDRAINNVGQLTDRQGQTRPIVTVLDVIDHLHAKGRLDDARRSAVRQRLRELGAALIPVEAEEIADAAASGNWQNGPPRPLRAIISSIHLPLLRGALTLPDEVFWLGSSMAALSKSIIRCWRNMPADRAYQAATWLLRSFPDPYSIVREADAAEMSDWADRARVSFHFLLAQPIGLSEIELAEYHEWYISNVAGYLGGRDRHLKTQVIDALASSIEEAVSVKVNHEADESGISSVDVSHWMLRWIPPVTRNEVVQSEKVQSVISLGEGKIRLGEHIVILNKFSEFLLATIDGEEKALLDENGKVVAERGEWDSAKGVTATVGDVCISFDFAGLIHPDVEERLATLNRLLSQSTLSATEVDLWMARLTEKAIDLAEVQQLHRTISASPEAWLTKFRAKLNEMTLLNLHAPDRRYFEAYLEFNPEMSLPEVVQKTVRLRLEQDGLSKMAYMLGPLAVFPGFSMVSLAAEMSDDQAMKLANRLADAGDPFSAIAAFQLAADRATNDGFGELGSRILQTYFESSEDTDRIAHDFVALSMAVTSLFDTFGVLKDLPLSQRRCAMLVHAGSLAREFSNLSVKRPQFLEMVSRWTGSRYLLAGLVERWDERWWTRERMEVAIITGQVRGRLKLLIHSIPAENCPDEWRDHLESQDGEMPSLMEIVTGPLDEYSKDWETQSFPSAELSDVLAHDDVNVANNALLNTVMSLEMPSDLTASEGDVMTLLQRSSGEQFQATVQLALLAAMRWNSLRIAEKTFELAFQRRAENDWAYRSFVQVAIAAAAIARRDGSQLENLESKLKLIVERYLEPDEAGELVDVLDDLQNCVPDLSILPRLRSAALLAA